MQHVRILICGLNYAPEPTGNAPYTTKLAEGLRLKGHEIKVVTGYPHYPEWKIAEGYSGLSTTQFINGVHVLRVRHSVPRRPGNFSRAVMEITFGLHSVLRKWGPTDVVLLVSPGLFAAALGVFRARLFRVPTVVWVQDLYSKGLEETVGRKSMATRIMKVLEGRILRSASHVSVIHERFRNYVIEELRVPYAKVQVIPNWTHIQQHDDFDRGLVRRRMGWDPEAVIALHAGNMGVKQGLENVIEAARLADRSQSKVKFVLLGHGNRREELERAASDVSSVSFIDPLDDRSYTEALRAADVLVVNELPDLREMSVPSKLTSYFATGLPVVAATHEQSATADEIASSGGGVRVNAGEPASLLHAVTQLANDPTSAAAYGESGRSYAARVLSGSTAISAYSQRLAQMVADN